MLTDKRTEEAADNWVSNNPDPEVRRMYGNYYRAFIAGVEYGQYLSREKSEAREQELLDAYYKEVGHMYPKTKPVEL